MSSDDFARIDASFVPWALNLQYELLRLFPLPEGLVPISEEIMLPPTWLLSLAETQDSQSYNQPSGAQAEPVADRKISSVGNDDRMFVVMEENRRLTPESHWQDVRHLVFAGESPAHYGPGDVLAIYPENAALDVNQFINHMNWHEVADKPITFIPMDSELHEAGHNLSPPIKLPSQSKITFRQLLTKHLDLTAIPRRSFFSLIAHFTADQFHKERLLEFTKPEYLDELYDYTTRPRRSIMEVLQEFDSVKIPWQWAANILPELRGRQFSIASGGELKQTATGIVRFELLVAIVKYKTVIKKIREGVCTRYLAGLQPGTRVPVTIQRGGLSIRRKELSQPAVMIGPGTGVAPMRSLIWERLQWQKTAEAQMNGHTTGVGEMEKSLLIYGCRNKAADYFYSSDWESIGRKMPLEVHTAFSRDQHTKVYVQDVIRQHGSNICRLIQDLGGTIYVCGSSGKMPKAVRVALTDIFRQSESMETIEAEKFVAQLEREGRYKQETW